MNFAALHTRLRPILTPTRVAFFASLILSFAAWMTSTINRDGMLYVDTARIFLDQGFAAAKASFQWPFISIFIALSAKLTGLPLEAAGYLMNALFMAGASAFLVATASRSNPPAAWAICLVALTLPGVNEYRNELLREFGCWFFIMAAFWLAYRWADRLTWITGIAIQATIGFAALFRPEAVAMIPALIAWQLQSAPKRQKIRRALMIGSLSVLGLVSLLALFLAGTLNDWNRIGTELARFSSAKFGAKADAMSMAFIEYARGQARTILFFGSLALVPVKFFSKLGILVAPLLLASKTTVAGDMLRRYSLFAWAAAAQVAVLSVFVLDLQFLAGRYVGLLLLFATPFIGTATWQLMQRSARWQTTVVVVLILAMLASTLSLSGGKPHFSQAGRWLAEHYTRSERIFVGSGRTAYYAGWGYKETQASPQALSESLRNGHHDLYVLDVARGDTALQDWIVQPGLRIVNQFSDKHGGAVIILAPEIGRNAGGAGKQ